MKRMLWPLTLASILFVSISAQAQQTFDYYLLDLSWSPQYCNTKSHPDQSQCGLDKNFGFVVHGLWPQRQKGDWPESCSTAKATEQQIDSMLDIMPSRQLVQHEWGKHGTCSGLSASAYFETVRQSFAALVVPERYQDPKKPFVVQKKDFIAELLAANPSLGANTIALKCSKGWLQEVGICLDKDGKTPRACGNVNFRCNSSEIRFDAKQK